MEHGDMKKRLERKRKRRRGENMSPGKRKASKYRVGEIYIDSEKGCSEVSSF